LTNLPADILYKKRWKGGESGMKLSKEALEKEAAFWRKIKEVDPRKVCHS
jgi:hypothetical protein